ncbi:ABC transporter substrate-binding protein [Actinoplanes sp. NPDC051633]|uniref:ABC transporter substrate-binding protein n=1 Tax=Actinoplanes sp. NPDC051633 TaxID=3155670 RepID=UPI0034350166
MRRFVVALVTAVTVLAGANACGSDDKPKTAPALDRISVGVIPIVDVAPIYLGRQKGFFASRGIDLDLVLEQGGAPIIKGVLAGRFQFGFSNMTSLMAARADGAPLKAVAAGVSSTGKPGRDFSGIVVPPGSLIRTPKDLAGKLIGVNVLGSLGDTTIRASVRKVGGDATTLRFQAHPFPQIPGKLQAKKLDAAWLVEPQLSEAITLGCQVIASNFVDTAANLTVAAYFTAGDLAERDPKLVERFTQAVNESLRYADTHGDEVRDVVGTYTPINDTVRLMMILPNWPAAINRDSVETLALLGGRDGIFKTAPQLDDLLP